MRYRYRFFLPNGEAIRWGGPQSSYRVDTGLASARATANILGSTRSETITVRRQPMLDREWHAGEVVYVARYSYA